MPDSCTPSSSAYPSDCEVLQAYRDRAMDREAEDPRRKLAKEKAKAIRLLLLDVDGVLTDGCLHYQGESVESKVFHTQDGFGLRLLQEAGLQTGIITARSSTVVTRRATELKFSFVHQGAKNKAEAFAQILNETGLKPFEIAYMGDDWLDLPVLNQVGLAAAPANGVKEVLRAVHYVCPRNGGGGAVRDLCDLILEAKGLSETLLQKYQGR